MSDDDPAHDRLRSVLSEGDVAVDVGANPSPTSHISYTEVMSNAVGETGLVIAFDPFPFPQMRDIASRDNVLFIEEAVSHEPLALRESHDVVGNFMWAKDVRTYTGHVPLDAVTDADVVKVDVEGFEWHVLRSADRLLEAVKPVWVIELHPHKPKADGAIQHVLDRLHAAGYDVFTVAESQSVDAAAELDSEGATDVIALP